MTGTLPGVDTWSVERVRIPTTDGLHLGAAVYRCPGVPRPVLLVRTPYSEVLSRSLPVQPALEAGFAVVVQDCRGTGGSDGEMRTFENETADGLDTLDWVVQQPWCDGKVVMFGMSYLGMTQFAVAGHRPDGLAAIAPTVTPDDYRDGLVYRQGAFQLGQALGWHLLEAAQLIGRAATRGEDVSALMAGLMALMGDTEDAYLALPLRDRPGVSAVLPSWRTWLERENDAAYWRDLSYASRRTAIAVPGLHVGGWFDLFLRGTLDNYTTMTGDGAAAAADQHLIVGPWSHTDQTGAPGEVFYDGGSAQAIRLEEQQLRFLKESVDGRPTSLPPVQIYVMGANRWRTEYEWPLARTDWQTWYLAADGVLGRELPPAGTAEYVHDPHDPVPTVGGAIVLAGSRDGGLGYQPGSRDQRELDARTDILRFTSPVLAEDVEVTGPLIVHLYAATSAVDADFTAKLVDVHPPSPSPPLPPRGSLRPRTRRPNGRAMGIADGIVRARYRAGMDAPRPVVPGEVYEYPIDLGATSQVFRAGHRIRVDVASSNFPCFDRNSGSAKPAGQVTVDDLVSATQQIFFGPERPSSIRLPVIPASAG